MLLGHCFIVLRVRGRFLTKEPSQLEEVLRVFENLTIPEGSMYPNRIYFGLKVIVEGLL